MIFEPSTPAASEMSTQLAAICVLIPVWQPFPELIPFVLALQARGFHRIVIVNDGSGPEYRPIFEKLRATPLVDVVEHSRNLGKGRALKSGFAFLQQQAADVIGVVTADADGQHLLDDVALVGMRLLESGGRCILGTRTFDGRAPLKNRWGNRVTASIFRTLTRCKISDTQTGLRGLPREMWNDLLTIPGERYDFETAMLVELCTSRRPPLEVPIQTVYLNGNQSTHFHPFRDSLGIYRVLFQAALKVRPRSSV